MAVTRLRRPIAAAVACALLAATACGDDPGGTGGTGDGPDDRRQAMGTVKADLARATAPADAPVAEVVAGLRDFALRLVAAGDATGNVVVSPASIGVAFAMAEAGAGDATVADIAEVFGFPDQPAVHEAMNALTATLDAADHPGSGQGSEGVTLELANAMWGQQGLELGHEALDTLATHYGAGVEVVDFAGDPEGARAAINGWVSDVTRERIPELVDRIDPQTVVALVNAVYLKASWQTPFTEDATRDAPFTLTPSSSVNVPTMRDPSLGTSAAVGDGYRAVRLPYDGNELSMVVVVPDEGTALADFEAGLDGEALGRILDGLEPTTVDLSLPRFEAGSALDLAPPLSAMGLPIPGADLGELAPGAVIGQAVHAANITVDEKGTEAAAATAVMGLTSFPSEVVTVTVDRPFLFVVQHDETGAPLFYGRITDPRG